MTLSVKIPSQDNTVYEFVVEDCRGIHRVFHYQTRTAIPIELQIHEVPVPMWDALCHHLRKHCD